MPHTNLNTRYSIPYLTYLLLGVVGPSVDDVEHYVGIGIVPSYEHHFGPAIEVH